MYCPYTSSHVLSLHIIPSIVPTHHPPHTTLHKGISGTCTFTSLSNSLTFFEYLWWYDAMGYVSQCNGVFTPHTKKHPHTPTHKHKHHTSCSAAVCGISLLMGTDARVMGSTATNVNMAINIGSASSCWRGERGCVCVKVCVQGCA